MTKSKSARIIQLEAEVKRLLDGIDNVVFDLANEDIDDPRVISEIHMDLVRLHEGETIKPNPFNKS